MLFQALKMKNKENLKGNQENCLLSQPKYENCKIYKFYTLKVLNGTDVVYKDKIFCTNQVPADYSINDGEYVQNTTNSDYVIIT